MTRDERRSRLAGVQKEIDDLNKQVADADNEGDEKLAAYLRTRLNAAKRQFTDLQQAGDDQPGGAEVSDETGGHEDEGTREAEDRDTDNKDVGEGQERGGQDDDQVKDNTDQDDDGA